MAGAPDTDRYGSRHGALPNEWTEGNVSEDMTATTETVRAAAPGDGKPAAAPWAGTASFGFLVMVAATVFGVIPSIIDQVNAFSLVFSAITAIVALLGWWLVRSGRRWRMVIAVVLAALGLLANGAAVAALGLVGSFWDFAPVLVFLTGAIVAVVAGIAAIRRLPDAGTGAVGGERRIQQVVTGGLVGVLAVSAIVTLMGGDTVPAEQRAGATVVLADDFAFDPEGLAAAPGDRIVVVNDDIFYHTFTIDDLGIDVKLLPGDEALVELPDDATGTFQFSCIPHAFDGEGMVGTLTFEG